MDKVERRGRCLQESVCISFFLLPSSFFLLPPRYDGRVNELRQPNTLPAEQHALTDMRVALRDQARGLVTLVGLIHSRSYEVQDTLS